ncbi:MAG: NADH-ubiquinone oxidoreductase chain, partial [Myxococcaceae bacterium]|nr:NADH-ubiquinone oxidoreductase chain [Myxococcaceae bacterium]
MRPSVSRPLRTLVLPLLAALAGCETQPTHEVLTLTELTPRQVEPGDRLTLHTTGLPPAADIRRVRVRLAAQLARPGLARCESAVAATLVDPPEGTTVTDAVTGQPREAAYGEVPSHSVRIEGASRIEFAIDDALVRSLTRCAGESAADPQAAHATLSFLGDRAGVTVQVETLQGTVLSSARPLRGPIVDLHLSQGRGLDVTRSALARAEHALAGVGLHLAPTLPPEGGLQVERVDPGSASDEAGVADGDVLLRLDGVNLAAVDDFRPSPGRDLAVLTVRRGDAVEDRALRVGHLDPRVSWDVVLAAVMVLLAGALLWSAGSRVPPVVRRLARAFGMLRDGRPEAPVTAPWSAARHRLGWMALGTTALAVP